MHHEQERLRVEVSDELRQVLSSISVSNESLSSFSGLPVMRYGFFPGGNGLFEGRQSLFRGRGGTLVLGSNFGCKHEFIDDKGVLVFDDERGNRTWAPLLQRLNAAGFALDECFFTNAWPFLHLGTGNLPKGLTKSWLRNHKLMTLCLQFFRVTLERIKPKCIIALGTGPAAFLSRVWPQELLRWSKYSMAGLDDLPRAFVRLRDASALCVAIAHPSMPNSYQRRPPYRGIEGEILLLKEAKLQMENVSLPPELPVSEFAVGSSTAAVNASAIGRSPKAVVAGKRRQKSLHLKFEQTFRSRVGQVLSKREIAEALQREFPDLPNGSVVPTDHAEPGGEHVNQCRKCADRALQIFDTIVPELRRSGVGRYRVRAFAPSAPTCKG